MKKTELLLKSETVVWIRNPTGQSEIKMSIVNRMQYSEINKNYRILGYSNRYKTSNRCGRLVIFEKQHK